MTKNKKSKLSIIIKAADIIAVVFLCIVLAFNLYMVAARLLFDNSMPKLFGLSTAIIVSPSMQDTIAINDMIIIQQKKEYRKNDIITFKDGQEYITHRIVDIQGDKFVTKGDNNNTADITPIDAYQIVGKVVLVIPKAGKIISFLRTPIGMLIIIAVGALLLYLPSINIKKSKNGGKAA